MAITINQFKEPKKKQKPQFNLMQNIGFNKVKVNNKRNALFFQELSVLLSSGIDIKTGLDIIISSANKKDIELIQNIRNNIVQGDSLSEAIRKTKAFNSFEYYNIQIGEETGNLIESLELLYEYLNRRQENAAKIQSALTYPLIVLGVSFVAVFIMLKFVVPVFSDVYARFDQDLPGLTRVIMNFSNNLGKGTLIITLIGVVIFFTVRYLLSIPNGKRFLQGIVLKIPYFGNLFLCMHLERFFHSLGILLGAKISIIKSLDILMKMTNYEALSQALKEVQKDLIYGIAFSDALAKHKSIFSSKHIAILKVGEQVNRLEYVIEKVKTEMEKRLQNSLSMLSTVLEPVLIVFVGLLVGMVLVSMYLPMFQMSSSFL